MITAKFTVTKDKFYLDVDLEIDQQMVIGIYGSSGAGKTTLLRAIAGLEPNMLGTLTVNGQHWLDSNQSFSLPVYQRNLGYVFQEGRLFNHLTVKKNILFAAKQRALADNPTLFSNTIEILGLTKLLNRYPSHLSGGEYQRVAIARAICSEPDVLLMDEPLANLDKQRKSEVLPFLKDVMLNANQPTFYVSHQLEELDTLANHFIEISDHKAQLSDDISINHKHCKFAVKVLDYDPIEGINTLQLEEQTIWQLGPDLTQQTIVNARLPAEQLMIIPANQPHSSLNYLLGKITDKKAVNQYLDLLTIQLGKLSIESTVNNHHPDAFAINNTVKVCYQQLVII